MAIHGGFLRVVGESGEEAVQLSGFVGDSSCGLGCSCLVASRIFVFSMDDDLRFFIDIKYMTI